MSNVIFKGGGRIVSMGTPSTQEPDVFVQMNTLRLGQALLDDNITVYNATWKIYIQREVLKHVIRDLTVIFNDSSVAWKTKVGYGTIEFMLDSELDLGIPAKSFLIKSGRVIVDDSSENYTYVPCSLYMELSVNAYRQTETTLTGTTDSFGMADLVFLGTGTPIITKVNINDQVFMWGFRPIPDTINDIDLPYTINPILSAHVETSDSNVAYNGTFDRIEYTLQPTPTYLRPRMGGIKLSRTPGTTWANSALADTYYLVIQGQMEDIYAIEDGLQVYYGFNRWKKNITATEVIYAGTDLTYFLLGEVTIPRLDVLASTLNDSEYENFYLWIGFTTSNSEIVGHKFFLTQVSLIPKMSVLDEGNPYGVIAEQFLSFDINGLGVSFKQHGVKQAKPLILTSRHQHLVTSLPNADYSITYLKSSQNLLT